MEFFKSLMFTYSIEVYKSLCCWFPWFSLIFQTLKHLCSQSHWPCNLRHRSSAACLLRLWVWIPLGAWMSVFCVCCVLSGLCKELITRPEEFCRLVQCCVWSRNLMNEEAIAHVGLQCQKKKNLCSTAYKKKNNLYLLQWNISAVGNLVSSRLICSKWMLGLVKDAEL